MKSRTSVEWILRNLPRLPLMINLLWGLIGDARVPLSLRAAFLGVLAYVASPVNAIPNFIPLIGQVDDLLILFAAFELFLRFAPKDVIDEIEQRYRAGHGPLGDDIRKAQQSMGKLYAWAVRKVARFGERYRERLDDSKWLAALRRKIAATPMK